MGSTGGAFSADDGGGGATIGGGGGCAWGKVGCVAVGVGIDIDGAGVGSIRAPIGFAQFMKGLFSSSDWFNTLGRGGGGTGAVCAITDGLGCGVIRC